MQKWKWIEYDAQNRAYLAYNTETPTPGYTLFGAGVGSSITNKAGKTLFTGSHPWQQYHQRGLSISP